MTVFTEHSILYHINDVTGRESRDTMIVYREPLEGKTDIHTTQNLALIQCYIILRANLQGWSEW